MQQQKNNLGIDAAQTLEAQHWYQRGRDYQKKKDHSEAIDAYEKALELDPKNFKIYNAMGVVYSIIGEYELGVQLISVAVRHKPLASYLHNNLGFAYLQWGRASEAAGAFYRALKLNPENSYARHNLATAYEQMGCVKGKPCGQWQEPDQQP